MYNDQKTTIKILKDILKKFRDDRDWKQFHNPKDLSIAISIEANELLELFLWKNKKDITKKILDDKEFREEAGKELADIMIFCINFANSVNFDITDIILNKIEESNKKYPIEKAKGVSTKYTKL